MARVSLQVKNIASLVLAAAASVASAVTVRRFFERGNWFVPAACLAVFLALQLCLIFVESKEEEELSLLRQYRMDRSRHLIEENKMISIQIRRSIKAGDHEIARKWDEFRRQRND